MVLVVRILNNSLVTKFQNEVIRVAVFLFPPGPMHALSGPGYYGITEWAMKEAWNSQKDWKVSEVIMNRLLISLL